MFNHIDRDEIHDVGADSGVLREGAAQIMSPIMFDLGALEASRSR